MRLIAISVIFVTLVSCSATESSKFQNKSENITNTKFFGVTVPLEKEWYVFDTCGRPKAFSNGSVRIDGDKIFIDFTFNRSSIAFEGTYDNYTGFVNVAGTVRFKNSRIGKEPRAGVFLPETNTILLSKKKFNRFSPCELILSIDDDDIGDLEHGNESLKRRLVHNYTVKHNDLWLTRVKEHLQSQNSNNPKQKLELLNAFIRVSKVFIKYSDIVLDQFNETASIKRDEYANLVINDLLNDYQTGHKLSLEDLDSLAKLPENESEIFGYLLDRSLSMIENTITTIINQHASKELSTYLFQIRNTKNIDALVNFENKYRSIFHYLSEGLKRDVLTSRAGYVYEYMNQELQRLNITEVEKIHNFHDFYYGQAANTIAYMNPLDKSALKTAFHKLLKGNCELEMGHTLSTLTKAYKIVEHSLVQAKTYDKVTFKDIEELYCYSGFIINSHETIVRERSHFVREAREKFNNNIKYCSVLNDEDIRFLKDVKYELPLYERAKSGWEKNAKVAHETIKRSNVSLTNSQCRQLYPYLPLIF